MACPGIATGAQFLSGMQAHIDCQARTLGSYGYGALADPRSTSFAVTTALLAIFIALHGLRLLFDGQDYPRRLVNDIVKIGIVLTLATSWPAWRIIGYDLVMDGPIEVAQSVSLASGATSDAENGSPSVQAVDDALVVMTAYGTGRLSGGLQEGTEPGDSFRGIALADQFALGWGRSAFLIGLIAPYGITRLGAGLLLAVTPLVAGLYLFGGTVGLFIGWTRGLAFCALGSFAHHILQAIEIGLIAPWAQDVIAGRLGGALTPSAPTELFVMTLSFSILTLGLLMICARIAFYPGTSLPFVAHHFGARAQDRQSGTHVYTGGTRPIMATRAQLVVEAVSSSMRQEALFRTRMDLIRSTSPDVARGLISPGGVRSGRTGGRPEAGMDARRTTRGTSVSTQQRDQR